jgi:opacity protein-like surface antigen
MTAGRTALAGFLFFGLGLAGLRGAETRSFQLTVFGGRHHLAAYGSDRDYVRGENDFPVTPAHSSGMFGFGLTYFFTPHFGIEYDGRFIRSSRVTSRDPSDGDELTFETNRHFAMSLELVLEFPLGRFRPYLAAGGGLDRMEARGERLTTALGHEIIVEDPAESGLLDPVLQAGGGLRVFLFKGLGLNLDGRYVVVLDRPSSLQGLSFGVGLALRL